VLNIVYLVFYTNPPVILLAF